MSLRRSTTTAAIIAALSVGCGDDDDRPPCNLGGNCFGDDGGADGDADGDADADADADTDGDGDVVDCTDPDGDTYLDYRCEGGDDCAEGDPGTHPGAEEVCNGIDDDCSEGVDEGLLVSGTDSVIAPTHLTVMHISIAAGAESVGLLHLEQDSNALWHLLFSELDADLRPTAEPLVVSDSPNYLYYDRVTLATLPEGWVVAFGDVEGRKPGDYSGILALATIQNGQVTAGPVIGDSSEPTDQMPAVAVGASTIGLVWLHEFESARYAILDQAGLSIAQEGEVDAVYHLNSAWPSIVWAQDRYLVAVVDAARQTQVVSIDEAGEVTGARQLGDSLATTASIAWDGFEPGVARTDVLDTLSSEFVAMDPSGIATATVSFDLLKTPLLVGSPRAFALTAVTSPKRETYRGAARFLLLEPLFGTSTELAFDDSSGLDAIDPQAVPSADGWVVAWIDGSRSVRLDRIGCP